MSDKTAIIYIVEDDPAIRDSITFLVSSLGYAHQAFSSATEFLQTLDDERPSCTILDVRLPGISGLELQRELNLREASTKIIFITGHGDIPKAVRAMRHGAIDFLEKPFDDQELLDSVSRALQLSTQELEYNTQKASLERKHSALTDREREVMKLVIVGKTSKAIALELNISIKTVENHRHNLMAKAGVTSVAQLIAWAANLKTSA